MENLKSMIAKDDGPDLSLDALKLMGERLVGNGAVEASQPELLPLDRQLIDFPSTAGMQLQQAFKLMDTKHFASGDLWVVDWNGCQGLPTVCLADFLRSTDGCHATVRGVKLSEQLSIAADRAATIVKAALPMAKVEVQSLVVADVLGDNLRFGPDATGTVVHIFADLLDREGIEPRTLASRLVANSGCACLVAGYSRSYFQGNRRIGAFIECLGNAVREVELRRSDDGTATLFAFSLAPRAAETMKHDDAPPPTCYSAAYVLDCVADNPRAVQQVSRWASFEAASPYYAASAISDDIHPLVAVVHNIVTRGVPTLASPNVEQSFAVFFGHTHRTHITRLRYESNMEKALGRELLQCLQRGLGSNLVINQMAFTPIEVARIHKVMLEAMLTGRLDINAQYWNVLVVEADVPCAAIAIRDLEELFNNIASISKDYKHLSLPQIRLDIISTEPYAASPLHLGYAPATQLQRQHTRRKYDLVIETSIERRECQPPRIAARNGCSFSLFTARQRSKPLRNIYSATHRIAYQDADCAVATYLTGLLFRQTRCSESLLQALSDALRGRASLLMTNVEDTACIVAGTAMMLQPGMAVLCSASRQAAHERNSHIMAEAHIDCCCILDDGTSNDMAWQMIENSACLAVSLPASSAIDHQVGLRLAALAQKRVHVTYFTIFDASALSLWSVRYDALYSQLPRIAHSLLPGAAVAAIAAIMPDDVADDIASAIAPEGVKALTSVAGNAMRASVQFLVERVPALPSAPPDQAPVTDNIDNLDTVQQGKLAFLGQYLRRLPLLLRELQSPDSLMNLNQQHQRRTACNNTVAPVAIPDNYLDLTEGYDHTGIVLAFRNTGGEVECSMMNGGAKATSLFTSDYYDDPDNLIARFEEFKAGKTPLLLAPMSQIPCVTKRNIRFAIGLGCPTSLEQLIAMGQTCGLDGKMAVAAVLLPHFDLCRIEQGDVPEPLTKLKGHWVETQYLYQQCLDNGIDPATLPIKHFDAAHDLLRTNCIIDNDIFMSHLCNYCRDNNSCRMAGNSSIARQWVPEDDYDQFVADELIDPARTSTESLAMGYNMAMPATDEWAHCTVALRNWLRHLLHTLPVTLPDGKLAGGLLQALPMLVENKTVTIAAEIPQTDDLQVAARALHRLSLLHVIDHFAIDTHASRLLITVTAHPDGYCFQQLLQLLLRHLPQHQAEDIANEAFNKSGAMVDAIDALDAFIAQKHSAVCRRRLADVKDLYLMAAYGPQAADRLATNEYIKDYLQAYYRSPYYYGDEHSLAIDTQHGRNSSLAIVERYARLLRSIASDHRKVMQLHGAVRRLLYTSVGNGALDMLDALCMILLRYDQVPLLARRIGQAYRAGYAQLRSSSPSNFIDRWRDVKNAIAVNPHIRKTLEQLQTREIAAELQLQNEWLNNFINRYVNGK